MHYCMRRTNCTLYDSGTDVVGYCTFWGCKIMFLIVNARVYSTSNCYTCYLLRVPNRFFRDLRFRLFESQDSRFLRKRGIRFLHSVHLFEIPFRVFTLTLDRFTSCVSRHIITDVNDLFPDVRAICCFPLT